MLIMYVIRIMYSLAASIFLSLCISLRMNMLLRMDIYSLLGCLQATDCPKEAGPAQLLDAEIC
jgi:hypothetical protein